MKIGMWFQRAKGRVWRRVISRWNLPYQPLLTRPDSCGGREEAQLMVRR